MSTVELEDAEWSQVISIIAAQHPLIAKISSQLVAQRQANAKVQGEREREHPEAPPRGIPASAGNRHWPE